MSKKQKRTIFIIIIIIVGLLFSYSIYVQSKLYDGIESKEFKTSVKELTDAAEEIQSTDNIRSLITQWAKNSNIKYTVDENNNIIIKQKSSRSRANSERTLIALEYNNKLFLKNINAYAAAEYYAKHGLNGSNVTVLFLYNDGNYHTGARNISKKYIPKNSRLILLTQGTKSYISRNSLTNTMQTVSIPVKKVSKDCDSAIQIRIGGLTTDVPSGSYQDNPIDTLNTILTRLKTKSIAFQLANVKVENSGNMYPTGITATILLNSYSLESVTSYLEDRQDKFLDDNKEDFPDVYYEFEELTENIPTKAYSSKAIDRLITFLYRYKNGNYRFGKDDVPEGYEENDLYGTNCVENLWVDGNTLKVRISTTAISNKYLKQITKENKEAASLSKVTINTDVTYPLFSNSSKTLMELIQSSYTKVNDTTTVDATIEEDTDSTFTALTFLSAKNKNIDAVHVQLPDSSPVKVSNAILNYPVMELNIFGF